MPALAKLLPRLDPAELARGRSRMSPAQQAELDRLLEAQFGGEGLADYIRRTRPHEPPQRHHMPIIELFERARREGGIQACISMPPRSGKTTTIRAAISWWMQHTPADRCGYASFNMEAANEQGSTTRDEARETGIELAAGASAQKDWKTDAKGGLLSAGIGTALTGRGINGLLIVDDPIKDDVEASSPARREKIWRWFNRVAMTRLEGFASVVVCQTRWHPDDLIGRLKKEGDWQMLNIPAISAGTVDILGRTAGESFWPDRPQFTLPVLLTKQKRDPHGFAALYQGDPRHEGARVFEMPCAMYDPRERPPTGWQIVIGVDPAATAKNSADHSVAVVQALKRGIGPDGKLDPYLTRSRILEVLRRQSEIPAFVRACLELQKKWWHAPLVVEAVAGFKAVPQMMRELAPGAQIYEVNGKELGGDKLTRALPLSAAWNSQRVELPQGAPWLADYLAEFDVFTGVGDAHDDQVDATSLGYNFISRTPIPGRRGSVAAPEAYG